LDLYILDYAPKPLTEAPVMLGVAAILIFVEYAGYLKGPTPLFVPKAVVPKVSIR
jgi:hypothetical protein